MADRGVGSERAPSRAEAGIGAGAVHEFFLRVYYEDTDLAGIVYYANYLKFIERARTEALLEAGVDQVALERRDGQVFAVRSLSVEYRAPARFQDILTVQTSARAVSGARATLVQDVLRGEEAAGGGGGGGRLSGTGRTPAPACRRRCAPTLAGMASEPRDP